MMTESDVVLVTGFGPFGEHAVNASWEAVSLLPGTIAGCTIVKQEIPVLYRQVEEIVPRLWHRYNPKLVVHVGVSSATREIQIETCANKKGYKRADIEDTCPANGQVCYGQADTIQTSLCARTICERLNQDSTWKASISNDPGRYLCEFIYYVSLSHNNQRTLFVHVPPLNEPFSKSQLARALEEIVKCALELIGDTEGHSAHFANDSVRIYKNGRAAAAF
ncbi:hypothetical protein HUJ04_004608 [Dendroctonus ponderosae]